MIIDCFAYDYDYNASEVATPLFPDCTFNNCTFHTITNPKPPPLTEDFSDIDIQYLFANLQNLVTASAHCISLKEFVLTIG